MSDKRHEARYQRRKEKREQKRISKIGFYDDFSLVSNADKLCAAFKRAKRGVSWKESVQRYEANLLQNVIETKRKLLAGEDVRRGFVEFTVNERGKMRHIKSVHISERIVQKCLCEEVLSPILERPLIHDNGASIKGKGTQFSLNRLTAHLRRYYRSNGNSNEGYALLIDFRKYFDSIDHRVLAKQLGRHIKDARLRILLWNFIQAFGPEKSLGLGSGVSQICAVFFPNKVDHFIKEKLRIKYYGRYMDDLYLIHSDKNYLKKCLYQIQKLCAELGITLHDKKTRIVKLTQGVNFLKGRYILTKTGKIIRLPSRDSTVRMRRKLKKYKSLCERGKMNSSDIRISYQSWRGNFKKRFDAYYKLKRMDKLYNELFIYDHTLMSA